MSSWAETAEPTRPPERPIRAESSGSVIGGRPVTLVVMWRKHPDQAAFRDAAVKLNSGSKGRRNGNIARDVRSRVTRSVALYGSADPLFCNTKGESMPVPLALENVSELRRQFPTLPDDYFNYLMSVGWGETDAGQMIYEGPTTPEEIYGPRDELAEVLLLGDDFQGYCFGYNSKTNCYGEVSNSGSWEPWPASAEFLRYVSQPNEGAT